MFKGQGQTDDLTLSIVYLIYYNHLFDGYKTF